MKTKRADPPDSRGMRRTLNGRIWRSTTLNILLVVICCAIMAPSMQFANDILLDSLRPMARQSAKAAEASIHMLADRMMTIAGNLRAPPGAPAEESRRAVLEEAAEIYELYTMGPVWPGRAAGTGDRRRAGKPGQRFFPAFAED